MALKRSLTIVLPVRDVQSTLAAGVGRILELASDLGELFELWIVDDASRDSTIDVARELARNYPQIRTFGNQRPLGQDAVIRLAASQCRGEMVFVRNLAKPLFECFPLSSKPVRPNFLGRTRTHARDGL